MVPLHLEEVEMNFSGTLALFIKGQHRGALGAWGGKSRRLCLPRGTLKASDSRHKKNTLMCLGPRGVVEGSDNHSPRPWVKLQGHRASFRSAQEKFIAVPGAKTNC